MFSSAATALRRSAGSSKNTNVPAGGVELAAPRSERRPAAEHDVELLVLPSAAAGLVVLLDQLTAGLGLGVGVHAERLDSERVPNRPPEEVERPQPQGPDVGDVSRSHRPPTLSRPDGPAGLLHVEGDLIDELRFARERPLVA